MIPPDTHRGAPAPRTIIWPIAETRPAPGICPDISGSRSRSLCWCASRLFLSHSSPSQSGPRPYKDSWTQRRRAACSDPSPSRRPTSAFQAARSFQWLHRAERRWAKRDLFQFECMMRQARESVPMRSAPGGTILAWWRRNIALNEVSASARQVVAGGVFTYITNPAHGYRRKSRGGKARTQVPVERATTSQSKQNRFREGEPSSPVTGIQ